MNAYVRVGIIAMVLAGCFVYGRTGHAQTPAADPLTDYRYGGEVVRNADGTIKRSTKVINTFRKKWACPSTKQFTGACPGWAIDHVVPLACGGRDAVFNMAWMPDTGKSCAADYCKDRWERVVYGGNNMSKGCP